MAKKKTTPQRPPKGKPRRKAKKKKKKAKIGRPLKRMSWPAIAKMCELACTHQEIADICEVDLKTLENRCRSDKKMRFSEFYNKRKSRGNMSIRRKQMIMALKGDKTMNVWLGKNRLGQSDKQKIEATVTQRQTLTIGDKIVEF